MSTTQPLTQPSAQPSTLRRWLGRTGIVLAGGAALALGTPLTAHAHVDISADTTAAGSMAVLTLSVPHGCDGSATTALTMSVPSGINEVVPTVDAGWTVTKTEEKLDEPLVLDDGDQLTARTSQVVWKARTPLADGFRAALTVLVELPEDAAGSTLAFPVVQTCEKGSTDWTQVAGEGVEEADLETPAPTVTVTAASADGDEHDHGAAETEDHDHGTTTATDESGEATVTTTATAAAPADSDDGGSGVALGLAGLVAGLLGLAAGVTALLRGRTATPTRQP